MNKYIISQLIVSLLVTFHASAMESVQNKEDLSIAVGECYLAKMPIEMLNCIASFLMESDEEFIERTKIKKEVPLHLYAQFLLESTKTFLKMDDIYKIINRYKIVISEFCPDETKIGMLELPNRFTVDPTCKGLTIIDLQKNDAAKVMHERVFCDLGVYKAIALSRGGNMIAMIYEEKESDFVYDFFEIQNITTKKRREAYVPDRFVHEVIAFNKQGTSLIAHGKDPFTKKNIHQICPLKIIDPLKPQVVDGPNKLQNYFRDKFISNKRIEGQK